MDRTMTPLSNLMVGADHFFLRVLGPVPGHLPLLLFCGKQHHVTTQTSRLRHPSGKTVSWYQWNSIAPMNGSNCWLTYFLEWRSKFNLGELLPGPGLARKPRESDDPRTVDVRLSEQREFKLPWRKASLLSSSRWLSGFGPPVGCR